MSNPNAISGSRLRISTLNVDCGCWFRKLILSFDSEHRMSTTNINFKLTSNANCECRLRTSTLNVTSK